MRVSCDFGSGGKIMQHSDKMLLAFRDTYDQLIAARRAGDEREIRHAEANFHAAAEVIAKRVPMLLASSEVSLEPIVKCA